VGAIEREQLDRFAEGDEPSRAAVDRLVIHAEQHSGGGDSPGRTWTRDEPYEDRVGKRNR
jgi:hypothetical protein